MMCIVIEIIFYLSKSLDKLNKSNKILEPLHMLKNDRYKPIFKNSLTFILFFE